MKKIIKGIEPQTLSQYRSSLSADESKKSNIYDDFKHKSREDCNKSVVGNLRKQLLEEQGFICCYCMSRINCNNSKIEHFKSQSKNREFQIDYQNLFVACKGGESKRKENQFCDTYKDEKELKTIVLLTNIENEISYKKEGKHILIHSKNNGIETDLVNVLNLNVSVLKKNRMISYSNVIQNLKQKGFSISNIKKTVEYHKNKHNGKFEPFCEMIIYFLTKKLKSKGVKL